MERRTLHPGGRENSSRGPGWGKVRLCIFIFSLNSERRQVTKGNVVMFVGLVTSVAVRRRSVISSTTLVPGEPIRHASSRCRKGGGNSLILGSARCQNLRVTLNFYIMPTRKLPTQPQSTKGFLCRVGSGWLGLGSGFKSASTPRHQKEKPADTEGGFGVLTNDADCPTVQNETCVANKSRLCGHAPTIQYLLYSSQRGEGWIMYVNW